MSILVSVWVVITEDYKLDSLNNKHGCFTFISINKLIEHFFIYGDWGVQGQSSGRFSTWGGLTSHIIDGRPLCVLPWQKEVRELSGAPFRSSLIAFMTASFMT